MAKIVCPEHGSVQAFEIEFEHYACETCFMESLPPIQKREFTFDVEDEMRAPKVGSIIDMDKCDRCKKKVHAWTAYYWFHNLGAWLCLNCIYKKEKPKCKP